MRFQDNWVINTLPGIISQKHRGISTKFVFNLYYNYDSYCGTHKDKKLTYRQLCEIMNMDYATVANTTKYLVENNFLSVKEFKLINENRQIELFTDTNKYINDNVKLWLLDTFSLLKNKECAKASLKVLYRIALLADSNLKTNITTLDEFQASSGVGIATVRNIFSLLKKKGLIAKTDRFGKYYLINKKDSYE